jgi:hypothetical protein
MVPPFTRLVGKLTTSHRPHIWTPSLYPLLMLSLLPDAPTVTLYRAGLANLNGDASRLLPKGTDCLMLLPPTLARPRWAILVGPTALAGDIKLAGRSDRLGMLRFRAPQMAIALFAALPDEQTTLRLRLEQEATLPTLFQLLPVA